MPREPARTDVAAFGFGREIPAHVMKTGVGKNEKHTTEHVARRGSCDAGRAAQRASYVAV